MSVRVGRVKNFYNITDTVTLRVKTGTSTGSMIWKHKRMDKLRRSLEYTGSVSEVRGKVLEESPRWSTGSVYGSSMRLHTKGRKGVGRIVPED